jgi:secondary thiamine-phosphate synthase enzyme
LKTHTESLTVNTKGEGDFIDLTDQVCKVVEQSGVRTGLIQVHASHTTVAVLLQENDPRLLGDIRKTLDRLVPGSATYGHPDNAHSHLRSLLLGPTKTIPLKDGRPQLGTWQSILLAELDNRPRKRTVAIQVLGD